MESKFICKSCNSYDNYNNSENHIKTCLYPTINKNYNDVYIFLIESNGVYHEADDYTVNKINHYWLYFSIDKNSKFDSIINIIRQKWFKCCEDEHITSFIFNDYILASNNINKFNKNKKGDYSLNVQIHKLFKKIGDTCTINYDEILTSIFRLTLIDIIKSTNKKKIVDKNNEKILLENEINLLPCNICSNIGIFYCLKCKSHVCEICISHKIHDCYKFRSKYKKITNDPRTCIECNKLNLYKSGKIVEKLCKEIDIQLLNFFNLTS